MKPRRERYFRWLDAVFAAALILLSVRLFLPDDFRPETAGGSPFTQGVASARESVVLITIYQAMPEPTAVGGDSSAVDSDFERGTASGVVVGKGLVLTNRHVAADASRITISSGDFQGDAELAAEDTSLDLALLSCEGLTLPAVTLGDSDALQAGDWAVCIGNPMGKVLLNTVTIGVISGLDRTVTTASGTLDGMIQTDAAINSGSSGGGLFTSSGELVGIPTRKYTTSTSSIAQLEGIGLCVPINQAKPMLDRYLSGEGT